MKKIFFIITIILINSTLIVKAQKSTDNPKYGIKQVTVKYKSTSQAGNADITLYVADYGKRECTDVKTQVNMFGFVAVKELRTIANDSSTYLVDMQQRYYTDIRKYKRGDMPFNMSSLDFANIKNMQAAGWKVEAAGQDTFMNKPCEKYNVSYMAYTGTVWVWNNIVLLSELKIVMMGMEVPLRTEATSIDETTTVDEQVFAIPAGFSKMLAGK